MPYVTPTVVDPNNPLGLTAAAPGYLPADQRAPQLDPDLGWSPDMVPGYSGVADTRTPEQIIADQQPLIDWGNMEQSYWKSHEQNPLPLILGALGAIAAPFALSALGVGAGAGAAGGGAGAAGAGSTLPSLGEYVGAGVAPGLTGATTAAVGAAGGSATGATIEQVVVTAAANGLSVPAIAASFGIPAATVAAIVNNGVGTLPTNPAATPAPPGSTVSEVVVNGIQPVAPPGAWPVVPPLAAAGLVSGGPTVSPTATSTPPSTLDKLENWVVNNPIPAAKLGLTVAGLVSAATAPKAGTSAGTGGAGTGGAGGVFPVQNPLFKAALPAPKGIFANLGARPMSLSTSDYLTNAMTAYDPTTGKGGAQPFFNFAVRPGEQMANQNPFGAIATTTPTTTPATTTPTLSPDLTAALAAAGGNPAMLTPDQQAQLAQALNVQAYSGGGHVQNFAVQGPGTGRSDSIPAKLSDGEYVMDAETVSLLGDGSNKAGAEKLDRFRVNLRKQKGAKLAKGEISANAKSPATYLSGGRV